MSIEFNVTLYIKNKGALTVQDLFQSSAFVFPGQGSQFVGMAQEFTADTELKQIFEQADDALSFHLSNLMFNGDMDKLTLTENAQPALLTASYVAYKYLEKQVGSITMNQAKFMAGHSLGEYSALVCSGALSFEDGLRLVRTRGQAMQQAVPEGQGTMAAILGLTFDQVKEITEQAGCTLANDNAEGQVVISGRIEPVEKACLLAKEAGAKRAVTLPVSAPFHSPDMQMAADAMSVALAGVTVNAPVVPVVMNVKAEAVSNAELIRPLLVEQVTGSVRWRESMIYMANQGVNEIIEIGAGKVLTGLAKRCDNRLSASTLNTPEAIDTFLNARVKTAS